MNLEKSNDLTPTPRDYSDFMYCGMKWVLDKNNSNVKNRKLFAQSYDSSEQRIALKSGQENESKCIQWVLDNLALSEKSIMFDGTRDGTECLNLTNELTKTLVRCKPDLIVSFGNKNFLYEFKAVKSDKYLNMFEFEANHAQIWCYSKIADMHIDKYYLFRYYVDPFIKIFPYNRVAYDLKEIEFSTEEDIYFRDSFIKYLEYIKLYDSNDLSLIGIIMEGHTPVTDIDKVKKCSNCYYYKKNICNKKEWEMQKGLY